MPAFLYLLLISKLCYCESLTSIELFDSMSDPPNNDLFELPTSNNFAKITEANARNTSSDKQHNVTRHTQTELPEGSVNISNILTNGLTSGIHDENMNLFSNGTALHTQINDADKILQADNTFELVNNATALNSSSVNATNLLNNTTDSTETNSTETNYTENKILNGFNPAAVSLSDNCPEEQDPVNIGPYEVPTQRDMTLHIRSHLLAMYNGFHTKAMKFLKDIKEATKASWSSRMFCQGPAELMHYRRCVRWVGDLAVLTTKSLVTALETMRQDVASFIQGKICNISSLNIDPIHLIRILAAERVSLEFALPDFLRQLHACASLCPSTRGIHSAQYLHTARLTNKDFVLRHYYTQQNYNQQLQQQYKI